MSLTTSHWPTMKKCSSWTPINSWPMGDVCWCLLFQHSRIDAVDVGCGYRRFDWRWSWAWRGEAGWSREWRAGMPNLPTTERQQSHWQLVAINKRLLFVTVWFHLIWHVHSCRIPACKIHYSPLTPVFVPFPRNCTLNNRFLAHYCFFQTS